MLNRINVRSEQQYKLQNSGVGWIGEMPSHWMLRRLKDYIKFFHGYAFTDMDVSDEETENVLIRISELQAEKISLEKSPKYLRPEAAYPKYKISNGDYLMALSGGTSGKIAQYDLHVNGYLNQRVAKLIFKPRLDKRYGFYYINRKSVVDVMYLLANVTAQPNFNNDVLNTELLYPPLSEQKEIASYLDRETELIDQEVQLLEEKALLYRELKQSLISNVVTRGLDVTTKLRDSGIEWIGEIPKHWQVKRVVDVAEQRKKKNLGLQNKNLLSLSYGKIKKRDFDTAFGLLPASFETYQIVGDGNIILRLTDLQNDQKSLRVGLVKETGIITSAYLNLRLFKNAYPTYFYYLLHSFDISKVFYWQGGGLRQSMKFDDIKVLPVIIPPREEQQAIAKYLDEKTAEIDQIVQAIQEQVVLLRELRNTLINDVVTGKIRISETEEAAS